MGQLKRTKERESPLSNPCEGRRNRILPSTQRKTPKSLKSGNKTENWTTGPTRNKRRKEYYLRSHKTSFSCSPAASAAAELNVWSREREGERDRAAVSFPTTRMRWSVYVVAFSGSGVSKLTSLRQLVWRAVHDRDPPSVG